MGKIFLPVIRKRKSNNHLAIEDQGVTDVVISFGENTIVTRGELHLFEKRNPPIFLQISCFGVLASTVSQEADASSSSDNTDTTNTVNIETKIRMREATSETTLDDNDAPISQDQPNSEHIPAKVGQTPTRVLTVEELAREAMEMANDETKVKAEYEVLIA